MWQLPSTSATVQGIDRSYYFFDTVPPRRSRVRDRNSRRILEAAREIIEEQGLEQLSMRRLASHIDVSVRTLYNLFGDKRGLLAALVQHSLDAVGTAVLDAAATDPIERLWQVVTISVENMVALPKAVLLAVMSDEELDVRLHWRGRAHTVDAVRSAIETGLLRDDLAPHVLVDHAGAVYRHILRQWALGEIDTAALRAGVLQAYDLALLAVARPRASRRLLEHIATLGPPSTLWCDESAQRQQDDIHPDRRISR